MELLLATTDLGQVFSSLTPYLIPALIILIVLGIISFILKTIKWAIIIGAIILIYLLLTGWKII